MNQKVLIDTETADARNAGFQRVAGIGHCRRREGPLVDVDGDLDAGKERIEVLTGVGRGGVSGFC